MARPSVGGWGRAEETSLVFFFAADLMSGSVSEPSGTGAATMSCSSAANDED